MQKLVAVTWGNFRPVASHTSSCAIGQGFYSKEKQHSLYCVDCLPDTHAYGKSDLTWIKGLLDGWQIGGYTWNIFHLISMLEVAVAPIGISDRCLGTSLYYQYAIDTVAGLAGGLQTNFTTASIVASYIFLFLACKFTHTQACISNISSNFKQRHSATWL